MANTYKQLNGVCKNCVLGCGRLEEPNFIGVIECEYVIDRKNVLWGDFRAN